MFNKVVLQKKDSLKISKSTRICVENHSTVTVEKKLSVFLTAVVIASFEIIIQLKLVVLIIRLKMY